MDEEARRLSKLNKRSGGSPLIPINQEDQDTINSLLDTLRSFKHYYIYNSQGSDYSCLFCGRHARPPSEGGDVDHTNCESGRFENLLNRIATDSQEALED